MSELAPLDIPEDGKLVHNITHFARALRAAGLSVGPGAVLDAVRAVRAAGFSEKTDFFWVLHACFVTKRADTAVFSQVFRLYWRDPRYLEHMMAYMIPAVRGVAEERVATSGEKRAAEALLDGVERDVPDVPDEDGGTELELDATLTMSAEERLRTLDFEQMSIAEMAAAKRVIAQMALPARPVLTRRLQAAKGGPRVDARRTLQKAARAGDLRDLVRAERRTRWPALVALCDISGSMSQYSRAVLHYLHAVIGASHRGASGWTRVHAFTFGTRLTNVTRHMGARDVDAALKACGAEAQDWQGGTRIAECLDTFNRDWSRRVLGQGAVVLLITDGLERGEPAALEAAMERLHLRSRRLVWINPLLRFDGFAPKAAGVRAMLPHVDCFRTGHNLAALDGLAAALDGASGPGERDRFLRVMA